MSRYTLLSLTEYTTAPTGEAFPLAGRQRWGATLILGSGGPVEVVLEAAGFSEGTWRQVATFGSLSGYQKKRLSSATPADITLRAGDEWLRARAMSLTGTAVLTVLAEGRFLDDSVPEDLALLNKETRSWGEALPRMMKRAEQRVVTHLRPGLSGLLQADTAHPDFYELMREAIARQTEHEAMREKLARTTDPTALRTWREMPELAVDVPMLLAPVLSAESAPSTVWRGR